MFQAFLLLTSSRPAETLSCFFKLHLHQMLFEIFAGSLWKEGNVLSDMKNITILLFVLLIHNAPC